MFGPEHLAIAVTLLAVLPPAKGGQCWGAMNRAGRCTESLRGNVTREECCGDGGATTAWSHRDLRSGELFFWRSLGGGVVCSPCKVSCEGVRCGRGMRCVLRRGRPACACAPPCPRRKRQMGEVCGSDGRTYKHVCRLLKRQCRKGTPQLAVEYFGKCQRSCERVRCGGRKSCLLDQVLRPHCVRCGERCPAATAEAGATVCGADNRTYASGCHLRQAACARGRAVPHAYRGRCRAGATCENIRCRGGKRCLVDSTGGGGPPRCVTCPGRCPAVPRTEPLCATNNYTYGTWCHMLQDACKYGVLLEARHPGPCRETPAQQTNLIPLNVFDGHL